MAKLSSKERNALPDSAFVGPHRSFPIDTPNRARNALARSSQFHPELKSKIKATVKKKYPEIQVEGEKSKHRMDRPHRQK